MTSLPTWRYEARQVGRLGWLAPLVALGATLGSGWVASLGDLQPHQWRQILLVGLEGILPLTVASVAVAVVARDPFREVQLAVPTRYRTTVLRRLTVLCGFVCSLTAVYTLGLVLAGGWAGPSIWASPLVWMPPLVWLTGFALMVGLATRSVALAVGLSSGLWVVEQLCLSRLEGIGWARPLLLFFTSRIGTGPGWITNRAVLVGTGLLFFGVAWVLMRGGERWMTEEEV